LNDPGDSDIAFFGLDLAWSARNPSGLAVADGAGRVLDVRADLRSDDEILNWVRARLRATSVLGIDMPTIVRNATGQRRCEGELRAAFARHHAGPHPANLARFPDGGRARALLDVLASDGVLERIDLAPREPGRFAFEVYPHPALVRLFELETIFRYKKKARPWPGVLEEWARYRAAMATLQNADPPLVVPADFPTSVTSRGYKAWEDSLDAIACAYVAAFVWRWGMRAPHVRVFGDLEDGYIVVPDGPAVLGSIGTGTPKP
jgi:predicted RNase H-like nuclease